MNIARSILRASVAGCAAIGVCVISMAGASAANVVFFPNADISTMPYVISLDGGASTFTFTDINDGANTFIVGVSTGGNAMVDAFVGFPAPFQQGSLISDADSFSRSLTRLAFYFPTAWSASVLNFSSLTAFILVTRPYSGQRWFSMATTARPAHRSPR